MSKGKLDAITDKVLAHRTSTKQPLKVIAGEPDSPLVIGDVEIGVLCVGGRDTGFDPKGIYQRIRNGPTNSQGRWRPDG